MDEYPWEMRWIRLPRVRERRQDEVRRRRRLLPFQVLAWLFPALVRVAPTWGLKLIAFCHPEVFLQHLRTSSLSVSVARLAEEAVALWRAIVGRIDRDAENIFDLAALSR